MCNYQWNSQLDIYSQNEFWFDQPVLSIIRLNRTPMCTEAQVEIAGNGQYFGFQKQVWKQQPHPISGPQWINKEKPKKKKKGASNVCAGAVVGAVTKSVTPTKKCESKALKAQANLIKALAKTIEPSNKGFEMMRKMGYKDGTALGKTGCGIVEPIAIELKHDRKGLGVEVKLDAQPKKLSKKERKRLRQEAEKSKQTQIDAACKANKRSPKSASAKVVKQAKGGKVNSKSRKHSPIRAPSPQTTNVQKPKATPKAKIAKKSTTPKKALTSCNPKRPQFSFHDPCTPQQLQSIALHFREDIELLNLRLETEMSLNVASTDKLIVAKICLCNNSTFAQHTFEFIRTEIVGWIGKYQHQQLETPIFYCMENNETHILVICEDLYAYDCLHKCINEITVMRTMAPISVIKDPPIRKALYCYGAVYSGIIRDPTLFLMQVKLHKSALKADRWIIISHDVCSSKRESHFLFLLDEPSALALTYHHNDKLFICMQLVQFTMRGRIPPQ